MSLLTTLPGKKTDHPLRPGDIYRAALAVIATLILFQLLWSARILVLTAFLGILFGLSAARAADWVVARVRINRNIAAAAVVLGTVLLLAGVVAWTGPTLVEQSQDLRTKLPEAITNLETWLASKQPALLDRSPPPPTMGPAASAAPSRSTHRRSPISPSASSSPRWSSPRAS